MSEQDHQSLLAEVERLQAALEAAEEENLQLRETLQRLRAEPEAQQHPTDDGPPLGAAPSGMLDETVKDMDGLTLEQLDAEVAAQLLARRSEVRAARLREQALHGNDTRAEVPPPDLDDRDDGPLGDLPTTEFQSSMLAQDPDQPGTNVVTVEEILAEAGEASEKEED